VYTESEHLEDDLVHTLRERGARYVVDTQGQAIAVLLTLEEYEHYLDLLDDEADSQDAELAARLAQAADQPTGGERQAFRDYVRQREASHADEVQG
jgi:PHD/YefM family antitoxin component YafN of YafNO toxin-antitoxin module